jgi:hypothetical protein
MATRDAARSAKPRTPANIRSMSVHRALALFYGLLGATFLVLLSIGEDAPVLGPGVLMMAIGAVHAVIAFGAAHCAPWARVCSMIVGCLLLIGFPIGTLIGGYLLASLKWVRAGDA